MVERVATLLLSLSLVSAGCTTPCDELKARAHDCQAVPGRYVDDRRSVCTGLREEVTPAKFDPFATCVNNAECSDRVAIDTCQSKHFEEPEPCLRFELWAAACGLEPMGTDEQCATLRDGMGEVVFEDWVSCITADGCPRGDDVRYDRCQDELFPPSVGEIIDACVIIIEWSAECVDEAPSYFPVTETSVEECVALAEPFTSSSFLEYAECLEETACDDVPGRLGCLLMLEVLDPGPAVAPCQRLVAHSNTCGSTLGGGSVEACSRMFARFTAESLDAFVTCIEGRPCDDPNANLECAPLLDMQ